MPENNASYTWQEVLDKILIRLNDPQGLRFNSQEILGWMEDAIYDVYINAQLLKRVFYSALDGAELFYSSTEGTFSVPRDFLSFEENGLCYYRIASGVPPFGTGVVAGSTVYLRARNERLLAASDASWFSKTVDGSVGAQLPTSYMPIERYDALSNTTFTSDVVKTRYKLHPTVTPINALMVLRFSYRAVPITTIPVDLNTRISLPNYAQQAMLSYCIAQARAKIGDQAGFGNGMAEYSNRVAIARDISRINEDYKPVFRPDFQFIERG